MRKVFVSAALLTACSMGVAHAAGLEISPVRIEFSAGQTVEVMHIKNNTGAKTVMQVSAFRWTQPDGKDKLTPTRTLLAAPPIFNIPPGKAQVIRIGLLASANAKREMAYRLIVTQVPQKSATGKLGVNFVWRFSIPVFVTPLHGHAVPMLKWSAHKEGGRKLELTVRNVGTGHALISKLAVAAKAGSPALQKLDFGGDLLAGASRHWTIELSKSAPSMQVLVVRGNDNSGPFHKQLHLSH